MKCFAFDLGRVLFDFDYEIALDKIKDKILVPPDEIINELFVNNFADDFEKGTISGLDFYNKFKIRFKASVTYEEFSTVWTEIFSPNTEMIKLVEKISLLYPTCLISNINELHYEYLQKKYPQVFAFFDHLVLSFKVKALKPEKAIYEELKKVSGCKYEDIIYIDDRHDLIHQAKQFKLSAIHFTSFENLISELKMISVLIPEEKEKEILRGIREKIKSHKKTLLVGIGNSLKSDDRAGVTIAQKVKGRVSLTVIEAGTALESYLSKISNSGSDLVIFIDAAALGVEIAFGCYESTQAQEISLYFTHDVSLKLATQYLQSESRFDILILAIGAHNFSFGGTASEEVGRVEEIISSFFIKNFPA